MVVVQYHINDCPQSSSITGIITTVRRLAHSFNSYTSCFSENYYRVTVQQQRTARSRRDPEQSGLPLCHSSCLQWRRRFTESSSPSWRMLRSSQVPSSLSVFPPRPSELTEQQHLGDGGFPYAAPLFDCEGRSRPSSARELRGSALEGCVDKPRHLGHVGRDRGPPTAGHLHLHLQRLNGVPLARFRTRGRQQLCSVFSKGSYTVALRSYHSPQSSPMTEWRNEWRGMPLPEDDAAAGKGAERGGGTRGEDRGEGKGGGGALGAHQAHLFSK